MAPKKSNATPAKKTEQLQEEVPAPAPVEVPAPAPEPAPAPADAVVSSSSTATITAQDPPSDNEEDDDADSNTSGGSKTKAKRARMPNVSALDFEKRLKARNPNIDWRATIGLIMEVQAELLQECLTTQIRTGLPAQEVLRTGAVVHWLPFEGKKNTLKMTMKIGENGCPRITINLHDGYRRGTNFDNECLDMKYNVETSSFIGQTLKAIVGVRGAPAAEAAEEPATA